MVEAARARLVVVSGPSGAGKTTVLRRLLECAPVPLVASVSATTRPPRPGEQDGVDYHFLSPREFERRRRAGEFLECFEVFGKGHWYGTPASEVLPRLEAGQWVVLEIDVKGARAVTEQFADAITIFISPGSPEELERRLRGRATESEHALRRRLHQARRELAAAGRYQHVIVNDDIDRAVEQICAILTHSGD